MRRRARVDDNQAEIVQALESIGCSVQSLSEIGGGCVDLLVGYRGRNILLEVKDGSKSPSRRELTADQEKWIAEWRGHVRVVKSAEEAVWVAQFEYETGQ